jgi:hypothetical protein
MAAAPTVTEITYAAVVGMPVPRTETTRKMRIMATIRTPWAAWTTTPPNARAAPVRVRTPTIIPEPASATAMVPALNAASTRASQHFLGVIQVSRSRNDRANVARMV